MLKQYWTYSFRGAIQKDGGKYIEPKLITIDERTVLKSGNYIYCWAYKDGYLSLYETEEECRNAAKIHINKHLKYLEEKKMLILKYEMKLFERLSKI